MGPLTLHSIGWSHQAILQHYRLTKKVVNKGQHVGQALHYIGVDSIQCDVALIPI